MPFCINIHSVTEGESLFTSVIIVVPNLSDCGNLELNSLKEFDQVITKKVEKETIDPNKVENMDDTVYNTRIKKVKKAELAVKNSIERFNSKTVSDSDLDSYQSSLKNIEKKLEVFVDNINDILRDLEDNDPRRNDLEARLLKLSCEVMKNENKIKSKMKEIRESQPNFIADNENLKLLKQNILDANKREEESKVERDKKLKINMEYLNAKIKNLTVDLTAVKEAKLLSDNKARHT